MKPLISIGMPVFNGEDDIAEAIESIINQTFGDFELIISDNCSIDNTRKICQKYADQDPRIQYYRQDANIGAASNFKYVLNMAEGKYFMWNAADDYRSNDCLEYYLGIIENFGGAFSTYASVNKRNNRVTIAKVPEILPSWSNRKAISAFMINNRPSFYYALFRTDALRDCMPKGQFDWSDSYLVLKIIYKYGIISKNDSPKYFAGFYDLYIPKPNKGKYIKPFEYFIRIFPLSIYGGPLAFLHHFKILLISAYLNFKIWQRQKKTI